MVNTPLVKTQSQGESQYQVLGHTTSTTGLAELKKVARDNGRGAQDRPCCLLRTTSRGPSTNQPDNKAGGDDCIQMRLLQNATGIALYDRNCSDKFVVACEVNHNLNKYCITKVLTPSQGLPVLQDCFKPYCPANISNIKDVSNYF
jgi:hypothetical protein